VAQPSLLDLVVLFPEDLFEDEKIHFSEYLKKFLNGLLSMAIREISPVKQRQLYLPMKQKMI
jgi:hypothetical protein